VDLTWRDAVSTLAMVVMLIIYAVYLSGGVWLISSAWATAAVLLIVGLGGRVVSVRKTTHPPSAELLHRLLAIAAAVFGIIALLAGLSAVVVGSAYALKIFIMASIVVWAVVVFSHV
jgi:hypothetical protein